MAVDSVAARYAEAFFASVKDAGEIEQTLEQLRLLARLIRENPALEEFFLNPGITPDKKAELLDNAAQHTWTERLRAFVRMLTAVSRAEFLDEIVEAFEVLVDANQGRVHGVVRSARKVAPDTLARLKAVLEKREGKTVELSQELDPGLIGGIQVRIQNRVIDASVRRRLADLHAQLQRVSVDKVHK